MKRIYISLSRPGSLQKGIDELRRYQQELRNKTVMFVAELAKAGIETAVLNCGEYGDRITFSRTVQVTDTGATGKVIGVGSLKAGFRGEQIVYANTLLLAEFGSGWESEVLDNVPGVGRGTFPGQIHANDPAGWGYLGEDGRYHHTMGEKPTHPMHSAVLQMMSDFQDIARRVFRS